MGPLLRPGVVCAVLSLAALCSGTAFSDTSVAVLDGGGRAVLYVASNYVQCQVDVNGRTFTWVMNKVPSNPDTAPILSSPAIISTNDGFLAVWQQTYPGVNSSIMARAGSIRTTLMSFDVTVVSDSDSTYNMEPYLLRNDNYIYIAWTASYNGNDTVRASSNATVSVSRTYLVNQYKVSAKTGVEATADFSEDAFSLYDSCRACAVAGRNVSTQFSFYIDVHYVIACESDGAPMEQVFVHVHHAGVTSPYDTTFKEMLVPKATCPAVGGLEDAVLFGMYRGNSLALVCSQSTPEHASGCVGAAHSLGFAVDVDAPITFTELSNEQAALTFTAKRDGGVSVVTVFFAPMGAELLQNTTWRWITGLAPNVTLNPTSVPAGEFVVASAAVPGGGMEQCYPDHGVAVLFIKCFNVAAFNATPGATTSPETNVPIRDITPVPIETPRVLNSTSAGVGLTSGGFALVVVYETGEQYNSVYANTYPYLAAGASAPGTPKVVQLNDFEAQSGVFESPVRPAVSALNRTGEVLDGFVAAWDVHNNATDLREIHLRTVSNYGTMGPSQVVSGDTTPALKGKNQTHPALCGLGDGRTVMAWQNGNSVVMQVINGSTITQISTDGEDARVRGVVCHGQRVYVLYISFSPLHPEATKLQWSQYSVGTNSDGLFYANGVVVHMYGIFDHYYASSISVFPDTGNILIAWECILGAEAVVRIQEYTSTGQPLLGGVDSYGVYIGPIGDFSRNPKVVAAENGFFRMVFNSGTVGDQKWMLTGLMFNEAGAVIDQTDVAAVTTANQWYAFDAFATRDAGRVTNMLVSFADETRDGSASDILFRATPFTYTNAPNPVTRGPEGFVYTPLPTAVTPGVTPTRAPPIAPPPRTPAPPYIPPYIPPHGSGSSESDSADTEKEGYLFVILALSAVLVCVVCAGCLYWMAQRRAMQSLEMDPTNHAFLEPFHEDLIPAELTIVE